MVQAADHPPGYLAFLAIPSALGMTSSLTHLLWSCVLGTGTVVLVGLLGRAAVGPRVGLLAATIAAVYPNIWIPDGSLQAETAAMFTTALALLLAYHYLQRPSLLRLVALGAACGAASLTRSELILLVPLLVVPIALVRGPETRRRLQWLGASVLATLVVIAPWVGYNLTRFHHPVYLSSQFEVLLAVRELRYDLPRGPVRLLLHSVRAGHREPPSPQETNRTKPSCTGEPRSTTSGTTRNGCQLLSPPESAACLASIGLIGSSCSMSSSICARNGSLALPCTASYALASYRSRSDRLASSAGGAVPLARRAGCRTDHGRGDVREHAVPSTRGGCTRRPRRRRDRRRDRVDGSAPRSRPERTR